MVKRLLLAGLLFIVGLALRPAGQARAQEGPPLLLQTSSLYRVLEEGSIVRVRIDVRLSNQDPQTRKKKRGTVYFYNEVGLPVAPGVQRVRVVRGDGRELKVTVNREHIGYDLLQIRLGRRLFYGQHMNFTVTYDLVGGLSAPYYIGPNVARFPTYLAGDEGQVEAEIPLSYDVRIDNDRCKLTRETEYWHVQCPSFKQTGTYAFFVDAVRPTARAELLSPPIPLARRELRLRIRYFRGEEEWARQVVEILTRAIPVLEEIMGFPYRGPSLLQVRQSTTTDTLGYEGLFEGENVILVRPGAGPETIIHEAAHLWSRPFAARWLYEGWAEWAARETMRRLDMTAELEKADPPARPPRLALADWVWEGGILSGEQAELEARGYALSAFVVEQLVQRLGLAALQEVNRSFLPDRRGRLHPATSESYRRALAARGYQVDDLWANYVLPRPPRPGGVLPLD